MAYDDDETPFMRRPQNIIIAALAVVVVVLALWMVLGRSNAPATTTPPGSPSVASTSTSGPVTPTGTAGKPVGSNYDSACGLTGGTTTVPADTPPGVDWQNEGGFYFPVSKTAGPGRRTTNGPWSCFGRTPTGAVLAAYTISVRLSVAQGFKAIATTQTVPGVGQEALLRQEQQRPSPGSVTVPRGFLVDSYTNDDATITFYLRQGTIDATCSMHVQWFGGPTGDWLLRLETDGGTSSGCTQGAPSRYVPWGPTS